ncbi:MAG: D-alanine--poly(phosphoribitol) ligase subunit DltA [Eubacterium pyruvativorans]|uniref:D-alanine--poly(phosphoribitol) ligase subunit DltA n=1 Tax=Eubacterium pyruvativorans TaxID=155865 RepID=UPI0024099659|nr:D-alanine--poly(phosphoribitol) ligase subunit DltA [Eubacterium pyruvativorans]MDD6708004.1 D-alanine--poly(phosphoribitol) ligase subunit DltA [Eubacterium pyruvativorans]
MNIIETIRKHAAAQPEKTAFHFRSGEITYQELWEQSGRLSGFLTEIEMPAHQPIPVYGHKDTGMPVSFLAAVRTGHPYVPLDTNMPEQRIRDILAACGSPVLLAAEMPAFPVPGIRVVGPAELHRIRQDRNIPGTDPALWNRKEDTHYIIFTSGSTGKPKGVQVSTGNLEAYLDWSVTLVDNEPGVFLNQAPFSFDLSVMDVYTGLATGSTILSVDHDLTEDPAALQSYLEEQQPNYWVSTPSFADLCLSTPEFDGSHLCGLRKFLFCGEPLKRRTAERLLRRFPETEVINTYGPTEATVCVTAVGITPALLEETAADLPVGFPKPGTGMYALDREGRKLRAGETGELVITGDTVSQGYFHNPEKTAAAFFLTEDGQRAYRTGDSGFIREDGMVFCHGRMDGQIKFHGYRIELGDIEKNLMRLPGVEGAAVFLQKKEGSGEGLTACVLQDPAEDTSYARRKWIRTALKERIPAYMVPRRIVFFSDFPMTMNGKLDRKKLGEMI